MNAAVTLPPEPFAARPEVLAAFLFGSAARGRSHRESDLDVAVLLDRALAGDRASRFELGLDVAGALARTLGRNDVDLVVLNDAPPLLAREIVTGGRLVFCRDDETLRGYVRDVSLRAADLAPFLARARRRLLERIAP